MRSGCSRDVDIKRSRREKVANFSGCGAEMNGNVKVDGQNKE